jgi:spoIIIJ-associated protein
MEEVERSAESVEEAVESALAELGLSEQEARIEIVQEPRGGFLGLKGQPAIVRVRPLSPQGVAAESSVEQEEAGVAFLEGLLEAMGLEAEVEVNSVEGTTYVDIWGASSGDEMGVLIGKHGHTVDALQDLLRGHVQRVTGERCAVQVDVEDYRKRRRSRIVHRAQEAARRVKKSGRPEPLEPMNSFERKIVHDTVAALGGLETSSEGEEPQRRVVIRRGR